MSNYYNSQRTKGLYEPSSDKPFKLSRSKIELFVDCPRCFYLDRRLGIGRPPGFPFTLNSAVDALLKKEFDGKRALGVAHPLMDAYGIDAVPLKDERMDEWRNNFKGIQYLHKETNFLLFGAIDDVWVNKHGEYLIVDYKSTSTNGEITKLDKEWHASYKRQMEIYQWLFRKNGFSVAKTGYFFYCNGQKDREAFDGKLEFQVTIIPYEGNDDWIEGKIHDIYNCLVSDSIPQAGPECDYCSYVEALSSI